MLALAATLIGSVPLRAEDASSPISLPPASAWHLDFADESCRLVRIFGSGERETTFYLERFGPEGAANLLVSSDLFKTSRLDAGNAVAARVKFGPNEKERDTAFLIGQFNNKPALVSTAAKLADEESGIDIAAVRTMAIEWASIQVPGQRELRLQTGPMDAPLLALRGCVDDLLGEWGIDAKSHANLRRPVTPIGSIGEWLKVTDYKRKLRNAGAQGYFPFRMIVGSDGTAQSCVIQQTVGTPALADEVCATLMRRARFEPALDAQGKPILSYFRSSVRFEIAD